MTNPVRREPLPAFDQLHERHTGLTRPICENYAEAACVCLSRHHSPPTDFSVVSPGKISLREVDWNVPSERAKRAWNNTDDATRDAAYAVCLAAVEMELGFVAIRRAETRTGVDYYLGTSTTTLENAYRLEISGVDHGDIGTVARRLQQKIEQARKGSSNLPALASVVGFLVKHVDIDLVTE